MLSRFRKWILQEAFLVRLLTALIFSGVGWSVLIRQEAPMQNLVDADPAMILLSIAAGAVLIGVCMILVPELADDRNREFSGL
jgi:hypothetical protein